MRYLMPVLGFVIGVILGIVIFYKLNISPPLSWTIYLGLATVAGFDSVLGGIRSGIEGKFQNMILVTGLLCNVLLAALLAWFGAKIGLRDMFTMAVVVVLGGRIFVNLSYIRRYVIDAIGKKLAGRRTSPPGSPEVARAEK